MGLSRGVLNSCRSGVARHGKWEDWRFSGSYDDGVTRPTAMLAALLIVPLSILSSVGCVYRLQAPSPPFPLRLRIVAPAPQSYTVRVQGTAYAVSPEGRVEFEAGGLGRGCSVYLFDRIPIRRVPDPTKAKMIFVLNGATQIAAFSLDDLARLPHDGGDVPQITLPVRRNAYR